MKRIAMTFAIVLLAANAALASWSTPSTPLPHSSYPSEYEPTYWTAGEGDNVKIESGGSKFSSNYVDNGPMDQGWTWSNATFLDKRLSGSVKYDGTGWVVHWQNQPSQSFSTYKEAREYVDEKFIDYVAENSGAGNADENSSQTGSLARSLDIVATYYTAARLLPGKNRPTAQLPNVFGGSDKALANVPGAQSSNFSLASTSMLRYEHRWYDDSDAQYNAFGASVRGGFDWDRITLDFIMPIDRYDFNHDHDYADFTRTGLMVIPRYYLLTQGEKGVDLSVALTGFYMHTWMDEGDRDPDHVGIGPFLALQKDFDAFTLNMGAAWQRAFNIDGDEEITGDTDVDKYNLAMNVGVPFGERWAFNGNVVYTHTADLPQELDQGYFTVGLGATYLLKDSWVIDAAVKKELGNNDSDNIEFNFGFVWNF